MKCSRCVLPDTYPDIAFDDHGVCNYCTDYDEQWSGFDFNKGEQHLKKVFKAAVKRKKVYDCLVPVSGGMDSSYTLYLITRVYKLTPLAVNFDNGFQTDLARKNLKRITTSLGVDLKVVAPDIHVLKLLYKTFLRAGAELCTPCELGGTGAIYKTAFEEKIPLIVFGTSARTEGVSPKKLHYHDVRYFKDVIKNTLRASALDPVFTYASIWRMFFLLFIRRIKTIQMPYYLPWNEEKIEQLLWKETGWEKGHAPHSDCFFFPVKDHIRINNWGFGARTQRLAALVRDGQMEQKQALGQILKEETSHIDPHALKRYLDYMGLTAGDIENVRLKDHTRFKTYLPLLSRVRGLMKMISQLHFLPENIEKKLK